jgi:hypothetical protein
MNDWKKKGRRDNRLESCVLANLTISTLFFITQRTVNNRISSRRKGLTLYSTCPADTSMHQYRCPVYMSPALLICPSPTGSSAP